MNWFTGSCGKGTYIRRASLLSLREGEPRLNELMCWFCSHTGIIYNHEHKLYKCMCILRGQLRWTSALSLGGWRLRSDGLMYWKRGAQVRWASVLGPKEGAQIGCTSVLGLKLDRQNYGHKHKII